MEVVGDKTWGYATGTVAYIQSNDFENGTWTNSSIDANTTNIAGNFNANIPLLQSNKILCYGFIGSADGDAYAVNISIDNGATWTTSLLSGSINDDSYFLSSNPLVSESEIVVSTQNGIYSSTDGISFAAWTDQEKIDNFRGFSIQQYIR